MLGFLRLIGQILWAPIQLLITAFTAPEKLLELPRILLRVSLPVGIAMIVFVFLLVAFGSFFALAVSQDRERIDFGPWWQQVPVIMGLTIIIPVVVYFLIRAWLEGPPQEFQDLDKAWQVGLEQLQRNGIGLQDLPIHLVIGQADATANREFFNAARLRFSITDVPSGDAPLHWYVTKDAIYLVCGGVGCLSMVANKYHKIMEERPTGDVETPSGVKRVEKADPSMTAMPDDQAALVASYAEAIATGTRLPDDIGRMDPSRTMMVLPDDQTSPQGSTRSETKRLDLKLDPGQKSIAARRLAYVCRLLVRARYPYIPINTVLVQLAREVVEADAFKPDTEGNNLGEALKGDLKTLIDRLQVRCTVSIVVNGLEDIPGFCELMSRVSRKERREGRFGKGSNNPWDPPSERRVKAVFNYAFSAFELWTYKLFENPDEFGKPGNRRLYAMLCTLRQYLRKPLEQTLLMGLAKKEHSIHDESMLFAGCYFCASGYEEPHQGFVRGVFSLLDAKQNDVAWSLQAQRTERRMYVLVYIGLAVSVALLIWLGLMLFANDF